MAERRRLKGKSRIEAADEADVDVVPPTPEVSYRMSRIRSKETKIEVKLRSALHRRGLRFRKNYKLAPGKPDIAFVTLKVAVFCDSSFWHGKDLPAIKRRLGANKAFWVAKLERNRARDKLVNAALRKAGWRVIRFWDEDIEKRLEWCISRVIDALDLSRAELAGVEDAIK